MAAAPKSQMMRKVFGVGQVSGDYEAMGEIDEEFTVTGEEGQVFTYSHVELLNK